LFTREIFTVNDTAHAFCYLPICRAQLEICHSTHSTEGLGVFLLDIEISQGSVATRLRCGEIFSDSIITNFLPDSDNENV